MLSAVYRMGFWSALFSGLLALAWPVTLAIQNVIYPPPSWSGIEAYAESFRSIQLLNFIPSLILASSFLVLMVCIHFYTSETKRFWSMLGLVFAIVYAVMASINYLIQFIAVGPNLQAGHTDGLALWVSDNPFSVFWALANSYAYMSISMFFTAWVFGEGRLERWIRGLFLIVGLTAPFQFVGTIFNLGLIIGAPAGLIWSIGVPLSCFLLATLFRRHY